MKREISMAQLIQSICLEFETAFEFKIFLHVLSKYLDDPHGDPIISYPDFLESSNTTNRNSISRGIDKLIEKNYIFRIEEGIKYRYKLTEKVLNMIKK